MTALVAIDPGCEESAVVLWDGERPLFHDKLPNAELLARLRRRGGGNWTTNLLAIEMIASYGMAVGKEVFDTVLWCGRFLEAWDVAGFRVRLVYRREVKLHLCETSKANDANIRAALIDRFGGKERAVGKKASPGPLYGLKGDRWAALAVAITAAETPDPALAKEAA